MSNMNTLDVQPEIEETLHPDETINEGKKTVTSVTNVTESPVTL